MFDDCEVEEGFDEDREKIIVQLVKLGYNLTKQKQSLFKSYSDKGKTFYVFFKLSNLQRPYAKMMNQEGFLDIKILKENVEEFDNDCSILINDYDNVFEK